jgi:hypothetical protein
VNLSLHAVSKYFPAAAFSSAPGTLPREHLKSETLDLTTRSSGSSDPFLTTAKRSILPTVIPAQLPLSRLQDCLLEDAVSAMLSYMFLQSDIRGFHSGYSVVADPAYAFEFAPDVRSCSARISLASVRRARIAPPSSGRTIGCSAQKSVPFIAFC